MRKLSVYILLMCFAFAAKAQDLNARVKVISGKIQTTNTHIFQSLETAMKDFLNGRKWTSDNILPNERIECNFVLNILSWDGSSNFTGELQIQSTRPVYNASYNTPILNVNDKDFDFVYTEGQTIDFTDQSYSSNLTSVMAFYAYVIIGMDYDTFSRLGGTPYFLAAQTVVTNAQAGSSKGWKAFDGNVNRYWLSENLNNKAYLGLREFTYDYHRNGLDQMADNAAKGRKAISDALPSLQQVDRTRLGAMLPLLFFTAKNSELISIFTKGDNREKNDAVTILSQADPANGNKYLTIKTSN
ncbi:DUF4835 family protein [Mucilaginibacter sp. BT774]|uniref:type IX secretion system protein PorD n=1 Tax=Mucilaginibacter sp. BT774 TaxID=3062276 RepID=UPI002674BDA9|nr:DUF4835 family protein [Mucilaginibacter sp. BT774]MDO3629130.1 DUF4835 family protein [Mucilaginibacter sp. BT774]